MSRMTVVNLAQYIADQKSIGAMEAALQRLATGTLTRGCVVELATRTLALVESFNKEAKQQ